MIGGIGYALLEILWRGHTHWSMVLAGGLCFIIFSLIAEKMRGNSLILKSLICALAVTITEFIFGIIFNIILGMGVWDYSGMPFNLMGQICPTFSLLWVGIAFIFIPLADFLNRKMKI